MNSVHIWSAQWFECAMAKHGRIGSFVLGWALSSSWCDLTLIEGKLFIWESVVVFVSCTLFVLFNVLMACVIFGSGVMWLSFGSVCWRRVVRCLLVVAVLCLMCSLWVWFL